MFDACSVPFFSKRFTVSTASWIDTAPGCHVSAAVSKSVLENTASRSDRCATAQATACSAVLGARPVFSFSAAGGAMPDASSLPADFSIAPVAIAVASNPSSAACSRQCSRSEPWSTSRL